MAAGVVNAGPGAHAQSQAPTWTFSASTYGWFSASDVSVATPRGTVETSQSAIDALRDLDLAVMGSFEARRGRWGFIGNLFYTDLTSSQTTPFGAFFSRADVRSRLLTASGHALYRVVTAPNLSLDLGAGVRAVASDIETRLVPGAAPNSLAFGESDEWVDPVVAARAILQIDERWFATTFADVGGFVSDKSASAQVFVSLGYRFNESWSTQLGYRYLRLEREVGSGDSTTELSGPLAGVSYRF